MPVDNIPWTKLANLLNNKRWYNDYQKRWPRLRRKRILEPSHKTRAEATEYELAIIHALELLFGDAEDLSEITWSKVDEHLFDVGNHSSHTWKFLCKRFCNRTDSYTTCFQKIKNKLIK